MENNDMKMVTVKIFHLFKALCPYFISASILHTH